MIRILHRIKYGKTLAGCLLALAIAIGYGFFSWRVHANSASSIREAERWLRQRENARARDALKTLLWLEPKHYQALLITGISLNADRKFPESIAILERIPESSEQFKHGGIALASSLIHDKQFDRAESVLQRHLQLFPRSANTCEELVRLNLKLLRQREAIALLLDYWNRDREDFWALPFLLELEVAIEAPHEYVAVLEAADRQHPHQAAVVLALARAYSLMGKTEQAQTQFDEALRLNPQDFMTHLLAAEFVFNRGDVESAQRLLNSETAKPIEDDRYWFLLCRIADQSNQLEEANSILQKALALRPNEETYLLMQAALLRRIGQTEDARSAALRAAQLAENRKQLMIVSHEFDRTHPSPDHCLTIADLLERLGHLDQASAWRRVSQLIIPVPPSTPAP